jgi:hypothetical protein
VTAAGPGDLKPRDIEPRDIEPDKRNAAEPGSPSAYLLTVMVALAERQRHYAAEMLHDGPMQEFTAVLLALGRLRKGLDAEHTARLTALETKLRDTVTELRPAASVWLADIAPEALLDAVLRNWVDGPLAECVDLTVDSTLDSLALDRQEIAAVVGLAQLVLHELDPTAPAHSASVSVRGLPTALDVRVSAVPATHLDPHEANDDQAEVAEVSDGDEAGARAVRMRLLATALRARATHDSDGTWTFQLLLPRHPETNLGPGPGSD